MSLCIWSRQAGIMSSSSICVLLNSFRDLLVSSIVIGRSIIERSNCSISDDTKLILTWLHRTLPCVNSCVHRISHVTEYGLKGGLKSIRVELQGGCFRLKIIRGCLQDWLDTVNGKSSGIKQEENCSNEFWVHETEGMAVTVYKHAETVLWKLKVAGGRWTSGKKVFVCCSEVEKDFIGKDLCEELKERGIKGMMNEDRGLVGVFILDKEFSKDEDKVRILQEYLDRQQEVDEKRSVGGIILLPVFYGVERYEDEELQEETELKKRFEDCMKIINTGIVVEKWENVGDCGEMEEERMRRNFVDLIADQVVKFCGD